MTQGELEQIPQPFVELMSDLEMRIMKDIIERIKANGFSPASADWEISRLQQLGESEEQIRKWIKETLEKTDDEVDKIFSDDVYREYYGHDREYQVSGFEQIPLEQNVQLLQVIEASKRQTKDTFKNLTGSTGFAIRDPATGNIMYSPTMKFYQQTLDAAIMDIKSGAFSYNTVLQRTINTMTTSGLRWINYDSGWHNRVDVAARRAVMTGFRQVQGKINEQVAEQLQTDTYEVTYHVGARPTHQPWQGRVWTMQQLIDVCGLGTVAGLHGVNCYHDYKPAIKEGDIPKDYKVYWGHEDKVLYERAKKNLKKLSKEGKPFNLTMLTVDTHFPNGYICDLCENKYDTTYGNAVACADRQVYDFVQWIKKQDFYEDTTIIIAGDHTSMVDTGSKFWKSLSNDYQRTVYNAIINPQCAYKKKVTTKRKFSTMDMFPTTLAALGVEIDGNKLGLGTNLFSGEETLREELGANYINKELKRNDKMYNQFY